MHSLVAVLPLLSHSLGAPSFRCLCTRGSSLRSERRVLLCSASLKLHCLDLDRFCLCLYFVWIEFIRWRMGAKHNSLTALINTHHITSQHTTPTPSTPQQIAQSSRTAPARDCNACTK